jgi:hypothetical protein
MARDPAVLGWVARQPCNPAGTQEDFETEVMKVMKVTEGEAAHALERTEYSRKGRPISVPDKIGISYVHVGHKGR